MASSLRFRTHSAPSAGYTLVELTVALAVLLVATGVAFAVYTHTARAVASWEREGDLVNAAHLTAERLAADLRDAWGLTVEGERWTVHRPGGPVTYTWNGTELFRQGRRTHLPTVHVEAFELRVRSGAGPSPRALLHGEPRWSPDARLVEADLTLRAGRRALRTGTAVTVTPGLPWAPLPDTLALAFNTPPEPLSP